MKKIIKITIGIIGVLLIYGLIFGGAEKAGEVQLDNIKNKVAEEAVQQYEIAKRQGDKIQIWTQAELVSAAYLQANDEENYKKWKAIEKQAEKEAMAAQQAELGY